MMTSPPRPPSPPLGPPRGTNFSRRKARQPLPPSPAFTRILTSSMNIGGTSGWRRPEIARSWLDARIYADELTRAASIAEHYYALGFCEERVVLADADVFAGLEARAALADQDGTARYHLAAEGFYAQALRVRIAPVF